MCLDADVCQRVSCQRLIYGCRSALSESRRIIGVRAEAVLQRLDGARLILTEKRRSTSNALSDIRLTNNARTDNEIPKLEHGPLVHGWVCHFLN